MTSPFQFPLHAEWSSVQGANGASMLAVGGRYNLDKQSVVSCKLYSLKNRVLVSFADVFGERHKMGVAAASGLST